MIARAHTIGVLGLETHAIEVEVDVSPGLPFFQVVGLPDAAVSESRERVRSALRASGLGFPEGRITVSLAPADLRKEGPCFDLPIALAIAAAQGKVPLDRLQDMASLGELSLDGRVRGVPGVLPAAIHERRQGNRRVLLVPGPNAGEAAQVTGLRWVAVDTLEHAARAAAGQETPLVTGPGAIDLAPAPVESEQGDLAGLDFRDVRGQAFACRAMEIVAAGGHNALLSGPPGSGKSMLAQRLPSILPSLREAEAFEVTQIYSVARRLRAGQGLLRTRPFRAPHHSCSPAGLVGGGSIPRPGELSLAHCGVLFLDEALEFPRSVLEHLRQPLENGTVSLSRAQLSVTFPARIMLVLALNPCPCGYLGDREQECRCTPRAVERYRARLSGPLLDRIDLQHEVARRRSVHDLQPGPDSADLAQSVAEARERQHHRYRRHDGTHLNGRLSAREVARYCRPTEGGRRLLQATVDGLGWSLRTHDRVLRVARTIADLCGHEALQEDDVSEAIAHRRGCFNLAARLDSPSPCPWRAAARDAGILRVAEGKGNPT